MEIIRDALSKARVSLDQESKADHARERKSEAKPAAANVASIVEAKKEVPSLRAASLDSRILERNRIVSRSMSDPNHVAFNMLRTRVRKMMRDNNWKTLAITSPSPGCGKTMISTNLAFAMARTQGCRTVVVDLDLKKPSIARTLGIDPVGSIGKFLQGEGRPQDCFVQIEDNLIVGLNQDQLRHSSELLQGPGLDELLAFTATLAPDIVLFDLPPMRSSDDALSFLPNADACLLVVASGLTTVQEVDECEQQIAQLDKYVGIVMNKMQDTAKDYYEHY